MHSAAIGKTNPPFLLSNASSFHRPGERVSVTLIAQLPGRIGKIWPDFVKAASAFPPPTNEPNRISCILPLSRHRPTWIQDKRSRRSILVGPAGRVIFISSAQLSSDCSFRQRLCAKIHSSPDRFSQRRGSSRPREMVGEMRGKTGHSSQAPARANPLPLLHTALRSLPRHLTAKV